MLPSHHWYGIIPGWLIFAAMVAVALVLFARRVAFLVQLLLKGKPASRWDHLPARVGKVLVYVIGQARLIGGDFWPGLMHATIFWGFIILTLGTIEFFGKGVTESFFLPVMSDTGAVPRPPGPLQRPRHRRGRPTRRSGASSRGRAASRSPPRACSS